MVANPKLPSAGGRGVPGAEENPSSNVLSELRPHLSAAIQTMAYPGVGEATPETTDTQRYRAGVRWVLKDPAETRSFLYRERERVRATWFEPRVPIVSSSKCRNDPFVVRGAGKFPGRSGASS